MSNKHIVVLKNDAVGDLVHSIKAIENLISDDQIKKITIFLSYLNWLGHKRLTGGDYKRKKGNHVICFMNWKTFNSDS